MAIIHKYLTTDHPELVDDINGLDDLFCFVGLHLYVLKFNTFRFLIKVPAFKPSENRCEKNLQAINRSSDAPSCYSYM